MVVKESQHINLDYLDMMADGDTDMRDTMLTMLLEELPTEMAKMRATTYTADWATLREVSHKMKSTLAFIGNTPMTAANKEIEDCCKNGGNTGKIPALMGILEAQMPGVMDDLRDCLG